ncbi:MAG TPA: hypothetical protein VGJ91_17865 [Polyangiaceae bacterium]
MADSPTLAEFKRAAGSGIWDRAFAYCNGLSLYEMLRGLDSLSGDALLVMKRTAPSYAGRVAWERIAFAIAVVGEKKIGAFPGISAADRAEAQTYLTQKKNTPAAPGSVDEAGRLVKDGLISGRIQDPKRELGAAMSGTGNLFVAKEIVLLLAALIRGGNTINHSPAGTVAWFNGDGRDHIHLQVERRDKPKEVYAAARYLP